MSIHFWVIHEIPVHEFPIHEFPIHECSIHEFPIHEFPGLFTNSRSYIRSRCVAFGLRRSRCRREGLPEPLKGVLRKYWIYHGYGHIADMDTPRIFPGYGYTPDILRGTSPPGHSGRDVTKLRTATRDYPGELNKTLLRLRGTCSADCTSSSPYKPF